jgi:hypothetical protein
MPGPRATSALLIAGVGFLAAGSLSACSSAPQASPSAPVTNSAAQVRLQSEASLVTQALNATSADLHVSTATLVGFSTVNTKDQVEVRAKAKATPHIFVQLDFSVPRLDAARSTVTLTSAGCHIVVTAHSDLAAKASAGKATCP